MDYPRYLLSNVLAALKDTPVVLLNGNRQTGKSTFAQSLVKEGHLNQYYTMDDLTTLAAATRDPAGFLADLPEKVVIDEIQRVLSIFIPIKKNVDEKRVPGKYLLTGSADVMTLPKVAESLAGRIETHTMWPLSQGEIQRRQERFIDCVFSDRLPHSVPSVSWEALTQKVMLGGFPEALSRTQDSRRNRWFQSYITTILQRDIRELSNIEGLTEIPNLLSLLCNRIGGTFKYADIAAISGIPSSSLKRYLALLQAVFLIVLLPPWSNPKQPDKKLTKSPKLFLNDTGLACYLKGMQHRDLMENRTEAGPIIENFVFMELMKQRSFSEIPPDIYHFRTHEQHEVDIVLEYPYQKTVGIEVKSANQVTTKDFAGLRKLQEVAKTFHKGIVLYLGDQVIPFGDNLFAMPLSSLWEV